MKTTLGIFNIYKVKILLRCLNCEYYCKMTENADPKITEKVENIEIYKNLSDQKFIFKREEKWIFLTFPLVRSLSFFPVTRWSSIPFSLTSPSPIRCHSSSFSLHLVRSLFYPLAILFPYTSLLLAFSLSSFLSLRYVSVNTLFAFVARLFAVLHVILVFKTSYKQHACDQTEKFLLHRE